MAKGKMFLKVSGILLIIFGAFAILGGIITMTGSALAGLIGPELFQTTGIDEGSLQMVLILAGIVALASGIINLIAGVLGIAYCEKSEKAKVCMVFGVIMVIFTLVSFIFTICTLMGTKNFNIATQIMNLIIGLVLPVLYMIGAVKNKSSVSIEEQ